METQIKNLSQEVSTLKTSVGEVKVGKTVSKKTAAASSQSSDVVIDKVTQVDEDHNQIRSSPEHWTEVKRTIAAEVQGAFKRRRNIVVSGLPDPGNAAKDQSTFSDICVTHLNIKPTIVSAKRLGQPGTVGSNRRLLVVLSSEDEALRIIQVAKNLRKASDQLVASSVYINPHLSPEESKQQFIKRQARREQKINNSKDQHAASLQQIDTFAVCLHDFPPLTTPNPSVCKSNLNPSASSFAVPRAAIEPPTDTSSSNSTSAAPSTSRAVPTIPPSQGRSLSTSSKDKN
jgi:hypothetical protein